MNRGEKKKGKVGRLLVGRSDSKHGYLRAYNVRNSYIRACFIYHGKPAATQHKEAKHVLTNATVGSSKDTALFCKMLQQPPCWQCYYHRVATSTEKDEKMMQLAQREDACC